MKYIPKEFIEGITMKEAIDAMRIAFTVISNNEANLPQRIHMEPGPKDATVLVMPSSAFGITGVKITSLYKNNPLRNLPVSQGLMVMMNNETGEPIAILDAVYLTALRTGAASGLAAELLSRQESKVLGIFGSNEQAEMQIEGVIGSRAIEKVFVFARNKQKTISFCKKMSAKTGSEIMPAENADDLYSCDIICTATNSCEPVFEHRHVKPGAHINSIGSYRPMCREIPGETIAKSKLVVDQMKAALNEPGDILIPLNERLIDSTHIYAELGEIVTGKKRGRTSDDEITVFKSVGVAVQDLALAKFIFDKSMGK
jgi:ornithine cyclodeaminase/alanine dehydrogenase-like protein (mu-crystallin family)